MKQKLYKWILKARKPGVVFYGHNVTRKEGVQLLPSLHLKPGELERTIESLIALDLDFLSLDDLVELAGKDFKHHKPWVLISFDDGYIENLEVILPIFEKYNKPFAVFVSSNHIATNQRFYSFRTKLAVMYARKPLNLLGIPLPADADSKQRMKYYKKVVGRYKKASKPEMLAFIQEVDAVLDEQDKQRLYAEYSSDAVMSVEQLQRLAASPLVTIGSHCHNHVILNDNVRPEDIEFEMKESRIWLEDTLNTSIPTFCYPNGTEDDFTETSVAISKKHYELGFTTISDFVDGHTDKYLIPRQFLLPDISSIINRMVFPAAVFKLAAKLRS